MNNTLILPWEQRRFACMPQSNSHLFSLDPLLKPSTPSFLSGIAGRTKGNIWEI